MVIRRGAISHRFGGRLVLLGASLSRRRKTKRSRTMRRRKKFRASSSSSTMWPPDSRRRTTWLTWVHEDFLKAQGNKEYVPFTVTIDPSKVAGGTVAFYWRVVAAKSGGTATPPARPRQPARTTRKTTRRRRPTTPTKTSRSCRSPRRRIRPGSADRLRCPAGTYDVFVVVKEPTLDKAPKNAPPPKASVIKQTITVPDFWNGELDHELRHHRAAHRPAARAAHAAAAGRSALRARARWKSCRRPTRSSRRRSELSTFMLIYNPKMDASNKPDVTVGIQLLREAAAGREVLQQDESADPERADAAAAVRPRRRPSAAERTGGAAGVFSRRRLPARDQSHRQAREQVADARREFSVSAP